MLCSACKLQCHHVHLIEKPAENLLENDSRAVTFFYHIMGNLITGKLKLHYFVNYYIPSGLEF